MAGQRQSTQGFQSLYNQATALTLKKDMPGLTKFYKRTRTENYIYVSAHNEKRTLQELLNAMSAVMAQYDVKTCSVHVDKVKVSKTSTVLEVTTELLLVKRSSPDKKVHTLGQTVHGQDVWIDFNSSWKLGYSKVLSESFTVDGKPVH